MTSSLTVVFSGTTSTLQCNFLPEITLDEECEYSCALLDLIIKKRDNINLIVNSDIIKVDCDIISGSGSYINGQRCQTIHQFVASVAHRKGVIAEIPTHPNYFPVKIKHLRSIQISIVDEKGKPLNIINGCDILCRINIKRDSKPNSI